MFRALPVASLPLLDLAWNFGLRKLGPVKLSMDLGERSLGDQ